MFAGLLLSDVHSPSVVGGSVQFAFGMPSEKAR
jgi:hypothetical protein